MTPSLSQMDTNVKCDFGYQKAANTTSGEAVNSLRSTGILLGLILCMTSRLSGEDLLLNKTIDGVKVRLWIPEDTAKVRGLLVNPADINVGSGGWPETMRPLGFGQVGLMIDDLQRRNRPTVIREALVKALAEFAVSEGRPELTEVPFLFCGFSKGGGWSAEFAFKLPKRTIAYGNVCCWVSKWDQADEFARKVPGLFIIGSVTDGYKMLDAIPTQYDPARKLGAPWSLALQWGSAHDYDNASALVLPYFEAVVANRLNPDGTLRELSIDSGWFGDRSDTPTLPQIAAAADYKGDKGAAVWLPDRYTAFNWRAFIAKDPPVRIEADGLPAKGKRTMLIKNGETLALRAAVKDGVKVEGIQFFDGDTPIDAAWKPTRPGAHSIHVAFIGPDGNPGVSNPALVVVKK